MKYPYIFLILTGLLVSVGCSFYWLVSANPMDTVNSMFIALKDNKITAAQSFFGGNTCNCPIEYRTWLKYESGHEPNLAFLVGHPFSTTPMSLQKVADNGLYIVPWQRPERVEATVRLDFSDSYRPIYLPLPLAFGLTMPESDWEKFLARPFKDNGIGLCLRLRPSIKPGVIASAPLSAAEEKLPASVRTYLRPKDCGTVIGADGKPLPADELLSKLPKLSTVQVKLVLVRRGQLQPWTISELAFSKPKLAGTGS